MAEAYSVHNFEVTRSPNYVSMHPDSPRPFSWFFFWVFSIAGIALFLIPAFIIQPFRHQTASGLTLAMNLRQRAPLLTLIALVLCLLFAIVLWQTNNLRRKIVLSSVLLLVAFSAVMSRLNYFEWMFHPVDSAQFESESASKLENSEMILALRFNDDVRAYPIREMAYHHILNDVVSGVPVAVTY